MCELHGCTHPAVDFNGITGVCLSHAQMIEEDCRRERECELRMFREGRL